MSTPTTGSHLKGWVLFLLIAFIVGAIGCQAVGKLRGMSRRASNANDFKSIQILLKKYYAKDHEGLWPPFDPEPGRLMFERMVMFQEYGFTCEDVTLDFDMDSHKYDIRERDPIAYENDPNLIDDHSFWYLAYRVRNEDEARAFSAGYRHHVENQLGFEGDLVCPDSNPPVLPRLRDPDLKPDSTPLEFNDAACTVVFIERPGNYEPTCSGGCVGYLDGHVEYIDYPGEFPMSEEMITTLESLDALGGGSG
jgi:hypothetical protein